MKTFKLILLILLAALLSVLVLQNRNAWQVHFLWLSGEIPGIVLLFITAATGFVAGVTAALMIKHRAKP